MITGKAEDVFEVWATESKKYNFKYINNVLCINIDSFWITWGKVSRSMKFGVYQDFFDSVGIPTEVEPLCNGKYYALICYCKGDFTNSFNEYDSRPEARTAAIQRATEILNERL
jgi:hypothetical protein